MSNAVLARLGIDHTELEQQFTPVVKGRTLILDGDGPAYRVASTTNVITTAIRRYAAAVLTEMSLAGCTSARVHLTAHDCRKADRKLYEGHTATPYQANRKSAKKPPVLETLREELGELGGWSEHNIEVVLNRILEADDAMRIDADKMGDCIIRSDDKDLRQLTQPWFEVSTGRIDRITDPFGWVDIKHTPAGAPKAVGHGHSFVLAQWLMGDKTDGVQGLSRYEGKRVGPVKAVQLVQEWGSVKRCIHKTLQAYAKVEQDALAELEMLWLRRSETDTAYAWLSEQGLHPKWQTWLDALHERHVATLKTRRADNNYELTENTNAE